MRHPRIVILEADQALRHTLAPLEAERPPHPRWLVRQRTQGPACLALLRDAGPAVLVVKLGRHLVRELTLVDEVHATMPHVPIVAVGDVEDKALMGLVLDLGASYVVQPPQPRLQVIDVVAKLMQAAIKRTLPLQESPESRSPVPESGDEPVP